jgi:fatty-acyl-CoA synthase
MQRLRTLAEALDEGSRSSAGYTFLGDDGPRTRSYADIRASAARVAAGLRRAGLERGDVVALVIADAEQFLTTLIGAAISGIVPASLYPPATTADLSRFFETVAPALAASDARAIVTTGGLVNGFGKLRTRLPHLDAVITSDDLNISSDDLNDAGPADEWRPSLDDVAFIQYTSGSTSLPRGVVLTHRSLAANIEGIFGPSGLDVTAADTGVSWLPLYHDMGLVGMSLGPLYGARPVVLMPPEMFVRRPVEWLRAITRYRATVSYAPNFGYDLCVRRLKKLDGLDLSSWRVAGCGAEPINAQTLTAFAEKFGPAGFRASCFVPSYGLAEHVLAATIGSREREPRVDVVSAEALSDGGMAAPVGPDDAVIRLVSCGRPLSGHGLRIVLDDDSVAHEREVGEIALAGPSVMLGYYKDPESTVRAVRDGWLHTGDLGYLSDGELFVCGRLKDLIVINGRKYHPQDLEWSVEGLSGVRRGRVVAFVAGDANRVIIVAEPSGTVSAASLSAEIRRIIGDLFGLAVGDVVLVPGGTIARTTSGKVRRAAVRALYERGELTGDGKPVGLHA